VIVVSDSSPLVTLAAVGHLDLLRTLFCIPFTDQLRGLDEPGEDLLTGAPPEQRVVFARAYQAGAQDGGTRRMDDILPRVLPAAL